MKVINISRVQVPLVLTTGETVFLSPRKSVEGVTQKSYGLCKNLLRIISLEKEDFIISEVKTQEKVKETKIVEEEFEDKDIKVIGYKPKKEKKGKKKKNG